MYEWDLNLFESWSHIPWAGLSLTMKLRVIFNFWPSYPLLLCAEMAGVSLSTLIIFKGVLRIKTQVSCMPGNTLSMCYTLNCNISNFINGYKVNATTSRYGTHQKKNKKKYPWLHILMLARIIWRYSHSTCLCIRVSIYSQHDIHKTSHSWNSISRVAKETTRRKIHVCSG